MAILLPAIDHLISIFDVKYEANYIKMQDIKYKSLRKLQDNDSKMSPDIIETDLNDKFNSYKHEWEEIKIKDIVINQNISDNDREYGLVEDTKNDEQYDNNIHLPQILITLENTNKKCIYKLSKDIEDDPINDNDFKELIDFIQQEFNINTIMRKLYENEQNEVFIENADDLQTSLDANHYNDLHLCLQNPSKCCCIVVIGTTGSGKSSLVRLLSGNKNVKASGSVNSYNQTLSFVQSEYNHDLFYLDTIGTGDSNRKFTDKQILKRVFKELYLYGVDNIKIIWSVKGDTERKEAQFMEQAEFINNLQENHDKNNLQETVNNG